MVCNLFSLGLPGYPGVPAIVPTITSQPPIAINTGVVAGDANRPYNIPGGPYTDSKGIVWSEDMSAYSIPYRSLS